MTSIFKVFFAPKKEHITELFQEKQPAQPEWVSVDTPPDHSCRVLICFEERDAAGVRVVSTGSYLATANGWVIDNFLFRFFDPYMYIDTDLLNAPE